MTLIDTLATAHANYLYWLARLHQWAETDARTENATLKQAGYWQPPRIEAAALDRAVAMADRFNRLFLRMLRALRDLHRYSPTVVVQHAGQMHLAGQQVNVAGASRDHHDEDRE